MLFAMEGIPAVYIQNLVGAVNDFKKFKNTNANRSVNRTNWNYIKLCNLIEKSSSINNKIYSSIIKLIKLRIKQPAFHPNATQFTLQLQSYLFVCGDKVLTDKVFFVYITYLNRVKVFLF